MSGKIIQKIEGDVDGRDVGIINGGVMGRKKGQILEALSYICCMSCLIVSEIRPMCSSSKESSSSLSSDGPKYLQRSHSLDHEL